MRELLYQVCFYVSGHLSIIFDEQFTKDKALLGAKNMCGAYCSDYIEIENGFAPSAKIDERKWVIEEVPIEYYDMLNHLNEKINYLNDLLADNKITVDKYKHDAREAYLIMVNMAEDKGIKWTMQPGYKEIQTRCWNLGYN